MDWIKQYQISDKDIATYYGQSNTIEFTHQCELIGEEIIHALKRHIPHDITKLKVLDFGCGIGRPLFKLYSTYQVPTHACDVNKPAIDFLKSQTAEMPVLTHSKFDPPLPYENNFFDVIYSISVWTHLEQKDEELWLAEIKRILKPGGIILISFIGPNGLPLRQKRYSDWKEINQSDLSQRGRVYIEHKNQNSGTGSEFTPRWGTTMHTPGYIIENWSKNLEVLEIAENGLPASQHSYAILKKPY